MWVYYGDSMSETKRTLIVAVLSVFCLFGIACGGGEPTGKQAERPQNVTDITPIPSEAPFDDPTAIPTNCIQLNKACDDKSRIDSETGESRNCCGEGRATICQQSTQKADVFICRFFEDDE